MLRDGVLPLALFLAAAVAMTWPLAREASRAIVSRDSFDGYQGRFGDDDLYALSVSAASGGSEP